jgi:hypothetical protein
VSPSEAVGLTPEQKARAEIDRLLTPAGCDRTAASHWRTKVRVHELGAQAQENRDLARYVAGTVDSLRKYLCSCPLI